MRDWIPEFELPAIAEDDRPMLIEQLCHGATSYKEIKERPVLAGGEIVAFAPRSKTWIEEYAPERLRTAEGPRWRKSSTPPTAAPTIAARIQDLYGVKDALWIANRGVRVRHPGARAEPSPHPDHAKPRDFWKESYPKIKQELQRKYPKHEWR